MFLDRPFSALRNLWAISGNGRELGVVLRPVSSAIRSASTYGFSCLATLLSLVLRLIFNEEADYANPIEPSAVGGMKMAKVIKEITYQHDFSLKDTVVYR